MVAGEETYDPGEPSVRARADVVGRLRARRVEIDEAIFARISDRWFDRTGSDDPEYVAGLRAAAVAALDYILTGIERSGESLQPVPVAALEQARRAARTGVGLDTVLRRYLAGYAVLEGFVMREAERDEQDRSPRIGSRPPNVLRDLLQIVSVLIDRLITAVSRVYGKELEQTGRTAPASADSGGLVGGTRPNQPSGVTTDIFRPAEKPAKRAGRMKMSVAAPRTSQRDRILEAMAEVAAERGFEHVTVKLVTERARVSTRTFYEEFGDLQECFVTVLDLGLERVGTLIAQEFAREQRWQDGVLGALASLLVFCDSEPLLARVWFVEAAAAGSWALERREQIAEVLRSAMVEYWAVRGERPPEPVASAGVLASLVGLVQAHLVTNQPGPLIELLGPMMGLVTSLYLDRQDRAREVQRGAELARAIQAGEVSWALPAVGGAGSIQSEPTLPAILTSPTAHRLRECVLYLAEQDPQGPGPSNREIGTAIGVNHKSQISMVLSQLEDEDLAVKRSVGPGKPNEWRLTPRGEEIARTLAGEKD